MKLLNEILKYFEDLREYNHFFDDLLFNFNFFIKTSIKMFLNKNILMIKISINYNKSPKWNESFAKWNELD